MEQVMTFIDQVSRYQYLQNALIASILVGIICGVIGCFIILRGMALMGDAISHAVLPGIVVAYMIGASFFCWSRNYRCFNCFGNWLHFAK